MRTTVQDLVKSCEELVLDARKKRGDHQDNARNVSEKISFVLATLQSGSRDTQACINAINAVNDIADLDTFATAGEMWTEKDKGFDNYL